MLLKYLPDCSLNISNMKRSITLFSFALAFVLLVYSCSKDGGIINSFIPETDEAPTAAGITGFVFRPGIVPASPQNISQLKVPAGFKVSKFADKLGMPRILVINSNGNIYASDREAGLVLLLKDANNDGMADFKDTVATIKQAHGLVIHNSRMYIAAIREIYVADINPDGSLGQPRIIIDKLPDGGQHPNRTLDFGPDGKLYISIGSTCNACNEPNPLHATMAYANADGTDLKIFAKGLRNTIGFGWHPQTREFWGFDHGIDWLGDNDQKEELNQIKKDALYGWPYIYGEGKYNPADRPQGDTTYSQYLKLSTLPVLTYTAHAAPMQMAFYTGKQFPAEYTNDAFVAMRGSWNRSTPSGYKVVRVHFENGRPVRIDDFLTGFLVNKNLSVFGRPVGLAVHPDGSLFVSDDTNGVIYRVSR
jgi:glucose/arabinose dehydrogenase